ncbi:MAG: NADPH-dependent F420 reductase [Candidatus Nitrosothermus koennekii]|nr:MAG: NADPH-dependent F420 reductase [Candidatus Nitrosothermus koennekii]
MKISIVGGTGGMGEGLALRWALNHDILIGSRKEERAKEAAEEYSKIIKERYQDLRGSIEGGDNIKIARDCDVLILSIPYEYTRDTCEKIAEIINDDTIVVSPIVPMRKSKVGFEYIPMHDRSADSAAEIVASIIKDRNRIVSTLHTISEVKLKHLDQSLDCDAYICGDDKDKVKVISDLLSEINGLKPMYVGPLSLSYQIEVLTPMLLNTAIKNKLKHPGFRIV